MCWAPRWMSISWHTYQTQFYDIQIRGGWQWKCWLSEEKWKSLNIGFWLLCTTHLTPCDILFIRIAAFVVYLVTKFLFCFKRNWSDNFYVVSGKWCYAFICIVFHFFGSNRWYIRDVPNERIKSKSICKSNDRMAKEKQNEAKESPIYDNFIAVCLFLPNDVQYYE